MRPPLVLLHGFLGCAADWDALVAEIGDTRTCLALDLPGHAAEPWIGGEDDDAFGRVVAWTAARIEAAGLGACDVLGYSLGGRLALGLMTARPDLLRRAVVVGASPGLEDEGERAGRRELDAVRAAALRSLPFEVWLDTWYAAPLFDSLRENPAFAAVRARRRTGRPEALAAALEGLSPGRQPPLRQRLATCPVPALLMAGSLDATYAACAHRLAAANPRFEVQVLPEAGHAPHLEQPHEFVRVVRAWLDRP